VSLRLEDELPTLRPDLVIVAVFAGNDFGDLLRNKLFRVGADGQLIPNRYRLAEDLRVAFELSRKESIVRRAFDDALKRFATRKPAKLSGGKDVNVALMDSWLREALGEYDNYVVRGDNVVTNIYQDDYSADVSLLPRGDSARYRVRLMEGVLNRIKDSAKKASVPLVLVFIPHPIDVVPNYDTGRVDRARFPDYKPSNLTDALEGIAMRNELRFVNLFAPFQSGDAGKLYFHGGDDHWNETGQRLAAELVARYLLQNGLVGDASAARKTAD
jgi:hypothetical protein